MMGFLFVTLNGGGRLSPTNGIPQAPRDLGHRAAGGWHGNDQRPDCDPPEPGGAAAEVVRGPVVLGPAQDNAANVVWIGAMPAGNAGAPLHLHPHTDEGFYVAKAELTFSLGDREAVVRAGTFVFVPLGTVHTARNSGPGPVRGLLLLSPGVAEHVEQPVEDS